MPSTHAAGVVISPTPLIEHVPLYKSNQDEIITQYDMKSVEKIGLLRWTSSGCDADGHRRGAAS